MENEAHDIERAPWLVRLHEWRVANVSDKMFLLILAFMVGLLSAVAAYILHGLINTIVALLTGRFHAETYNWLYLVYPVVGIWLTSLFVRYHRDAARRPPPCNGDRVRYAVFCV